MRRPYPLPTQSRQRHIAASLVALWAPLLFWACAAVGPDYAPPPMDVPSHWRAAMADGLVPTPADADTLAQWWTTLDDPMRRGGQH